MNTYFRIVSLSPSFPLLLYFHLLIVIILFAFAHPTAISVSSFLPLSPFLCSYLGGSVSTIFPRAICVIYITRAVHKWRNGIPCACTQRASSVSLHRPYFIFSFFSVLAEWTIKNREILRIAVCAGGARRTYNARCGYIEYKLTYLCTYHFMILIEYKL